MRRLGLHYIPDTKHYRQSDLSTWLPELKALGASWLVLVAPAGRAIPEHFLRGLLEAGIEPVLHFPLRPDQLPPIEDLLLLFKTYARWGVRYAALFDSPNIRSVWRGTAWAQTDLVERFLDIYLPVADASLRAGLTPIFPPLKPGGDYWDTAFLRASLQGIKRRGHKSLLEKLVLGAYAWAGDRHLNWGAGGPERWPGARPYFTPQDEEDQRGFRIFDWYSILAQSVLLDPLPIFLFGMGCRPGTAPEFEGHTQKHLSIARLLEGEKVTGLEAIPPGVLGGAFWLLAAPPESQHAPQAWFRPRGVTLPIVGATRQWAAGRSNNASRPPTESRYISHYLLLPTYEWGIADFHLDIIRPFIKKNQPTIGFSIDEARQARLVTVVGGTRSFPEDELNELRAAGCVVEYIEGHGTNIASKLARM